MNTRNSPLRIVARLARRLSLFLAVLSLSLQLAGAAGLAPPIHAEAQEQVMEIIQRLFGYPREESVTTNAPAASIDALAHLELRLREASRLMPERLDLRYGIASALIGQALQTNTPFALRMRRALTVYQEIWALDTNSFHAPLLYAAYSRALGEPNAAETVLARLRTRDRDRTARYVQRFARAEALLALSPNYDVSTLRFAGTNEAIVILGAALQTNCLMKTKLVARLEQGLRLSRLNPAAPVIVTGGNAVCGVTEAYLMAGWLTDRGLPPERLYLEDHAGDTVGNAMRSCAILEKLGIRAAAIVTSASHVKRALAVFEEAAFQRGLHIEFSHLAALEETEPDGARERVAIFRDLLRTSGIWAYPGIQR